MSKAGVCAPFPDGLADFADGLAGFADGLADVLADVSADALAEGAGCISESRVPGSTVRLGSCVESCDKMRGSKDKRLC